MLLIFRLFISLLRTCFRKRRPLLLDFESHFRVLPLDSEFMAMNAARYLSFVELNVLECNICNGFIRECFKHGWWPVGVAQSIHYLRPIKIFEKFSATTTLLGWDEKYFYRKFVFRKDGKTCCVVFQKSTIRSKHGLIKPEDIALALNYSEGSPKLNPEVLSLLAKPTL